MSENDSQTPFLDTLRRKMAETRIDERSAMREANSLVVSGQTSGVAESITVGLATRLFLSGKLGEYVEAVTEIKGEFAKASVQQLANSKLRMEQQEHWEKEFNKALDTFLRELEHIEKKCRKFPHIARALARTPAQQFICATIPPEWARDAAFINGLVDQFMNDIE